MKFYQTMVFVIFCIMYTPVIFGAETTDKFQNIFYKETGSRQIVFINSEIKVGKMWLEENTGHIVCKLYSYSCSNSGVPCSDAHYIPLEDMNQVQEGSCLVPFSFIPNEDQEKQKIKNGKITIEGKNYVLKPSKSRVLSCVSDKILGCVSNNEEIIITCENNGLVRKWEKLKNSEISKVDTDKKAELRSEQVVKKAKNIDEQPIVSSAKTTGIRKAVKMIVIASISIILLAIVFKQTTSKLWNKAFTIRL